MIFTSPAPQRHNLEQSSLFAEIFQEKPRTLQEQRLGGVRGRKERKAGTLWSVVSLVAAAQTLPSFLLLLGSQLDTRRLAPALPSGGGPAWQGGWRTVILMPSPAPTPGFPGNGNNSPRAGSGGFKKENNPLADIAFGRHHTRWTQNSEKCGRHSQLPSIESAGAGAADRPWEWNRTKPSTEGAPAWGAEELASETPKTPEEHGESLATFGTAGAEKSRGPKWRHLC